MQNFNILKLWYIDFIGHKHVGNILIKKILY